MASVIRRFEAEFFAQYAARTLPSQRVALAALKLCRTQLAPHMLAQCGGCGEQQLVPHSCGHRHCPHCQHHESQRWTRRQLAAQVPARYFMLTFTLPAELRALAWRHQSGVYGALLDCAWATVNEFSRNDKKLRGTPGAVAVLHTHSRRLDYHPHVHLVMPAAALGDDRKLGRKKLWRVKCAASENEADKPYLFNHKALAKVFRAKLLAALAEQGLSLPASVPKTWVVDCRAVGSGAKALIYLGRYLYRGVIQEKDILHCEDGQVTFRYCDAASGKMLLRTVSGAAFLWMVLQHVLPKGFRRARNFGFLHPNSKRLIKLLQWVLKLAVFALQKPTPPRPAWLCACCGQPMQIVRRRIAPAQAPLARPRQPAQAASAMQ